MSTRKGKLRSKVWEHFDKTEDGTRAICRSCRADLLGKSTEGTTHLERHIGSPSCKKRSNKNANLPPTQNSRNSGSTGDETLENKVKAAIVGEIPFANLGSKKNFYNLTGFMDPEKEIHAYCEREKEKMAIEFKNLTSRVSLSFEIIMEDYISITAHYIDGEFNLLRKVIGFKKIDPDPDKYLLSVLDAIKSCISDWKLEDKIFAIQDFTEKSRKISPNTLLNDMYCYVPCFQDGFKKMDFFEKLSRLYKEKVCEIRNFVRAVKIVPDRMAIFNNIAYENGLSHIDTLLVNKWHHPFNYFFGAESMKYAIKMLKQVIEYKNVFSRYAEKAGRSSMTVDEDDSFFMDTNTEAGQPSLVQNTETGRFWEPLSNFIKKNTETGQPPLAESNICSIDWNGVQNLVQISELVLKIVEEPSACNYPTSNLVFKNIVEIEQLVIKLSGMMYGDFYNLIKDNQFGLYNIAHTLDPRYKQTFCEYVLKEIIAPHMEWDSDEDKKKIEEVFCAYANEENREPSDACIESSNTQDPVSSSNSIHHTCGVVSMFNKEMEKNRKCELDRYLDDKLVRFEDPSLLSWWKQNESEYPVLSMMARDFLAVPTANKFSIEDIIDKSWDTLDKVSPQLLEAVICTKAWIHSDPPKHTRVEYLSEQGFMLEKSYIMETTR